MESVGAIVVRRHHGDGHGSCYCHSQHRSVDRFDARLYRDGDGRHPDRPVTEAYRLRSTGDLASHVGSGTPAWRNPWRAAGICDRLSRHTFLHRHARRPAGLAGRGMVGNERSDGRTAGHHFQADGRRSGGLDRRDLELDGRPPRMRRDRGAAGAWSRPAQKIPLSASTDGGGSPAWRRRLRSGAGRGRNLQRLSLAGRQCAPLRGSEPYPASRRRAFYRAWHRRSGPDRDRCRGGDDFPGDANALRPLCLRHRRQPGGRRTRRRQYALGDHEDISC